MNLLTHSCKSGNQDVRIFPIDFNFIEGANFLELTTNIRMFSNYFFFTHVSVEILPL